MTRLFLLFALLACVFTACFRFIQPSDDRLTSIPTPPHQQAVKIYFPGEKLPDEPYIKIKLISAKNHALAATTSVVKDLAARAQKEGADAILILGKNNYTTTDETTVTTTDSTGTKTTTTSSSTDWQSVDALCIKYIKNINYLDRYLKQKQLLVYEDHSWKQVASIDFNPNGVPVHHSGDANWIALVESYELGAVWPEAELSRLKWSNLPDRNKSTRWFSTRHPFWPLRQYRLIKSPEGKLLSIEFRPSNGGNPADRGQSRYFYDDSGRPLLRLLETPAYGILFEQYQWDENGRCLYADLTRTDDGQETPLLRVACRYFQNSDFAELLPQNE